MEISSIITFVTKSETSSIFATILGTLGTIAVIYFGYKKLKKQIENDPKFSIFCLEKIEKIFSNLDIMIQGFNCAGLFCHLLEHRVPKFSMEDSTETVSFAQRSNTFYRLGQETMRFCRSFTFIVSQKKLPKTHDDIEKIITFLTKKRPGQKTNLEIACDKLSNYLYCSSGEANKESVKAMLNNKEECKKFGVKLTELHSKLNEAVKEELPQLINKF